MFTNFESIHLETPPPSKWILPERPLTGYTGRLENTFATTRPDEASYGHVLDSPMKKDTTVLGYAGHIPGNSFRNPGSSNRESRRQRTVTPQPSKDDTEEMMRLDFQKMALVERYSAALEDLHRSGQNQQMLLRLVQAKLSERVNSYAEQAIRVRKIFMAFDKNFDGVLDENEFRLFLETINVQFNDRQMLSLFAYFDVTNDGAIDWEEFAQHAMLPNPKGGVAVLPKQITATLKSGYWDPTDKCTFKHTNKV